MTSQEKFTIAMGPLRHHRRELLDLADLTKPLQFDFKWADNISSGSDAMEFYMHGNAAPNARFNYRFTEYPAN
ncbi:hypothetical protein [Paenibacillus sp. GCM10027626]|uniref:hypothetical protein n=1 Tax=Paenibacillus sp. GCM10027626 TaxID=3273411 RepID=UPI003642B1CD